MVVKGRSANEDEGLRKGKLPVILEMIEKKRVVKDPIATLSRTHEAPMRKKGA